MIKYYKLKDACSCYTYVFEDGNNILKAHFVEIEQGEVIPQTYNGNIYFDTYSYKESKEDALEYDYLGISEITEKEYWNGIINNYILELKWNKTCVKESIKRLKEELKKCDKEGEE